MNDPRMVNDPGTAEALGPAKEIHAMRLMIQDETAGMSPAEKAAYHKRGAEALFSSLGLPPPQYVNMTGRGKLKPRAAGMTDPEKPPAAAVEKQRNQSPPSLR